MSTQFPAYNPDRIVGPTEECFSPATIVSFLEGREQSQQERDHCNVCEYCKDRVERSIRLASYLK